MFLMERFLRRDKAVLRRKGETVDTMQPWYEDTIPGTPAVGVLNAVALPPNDEAGARATSRRVWAERPLREA